MVELTCVLRCLATVPILAVKLNSTVPEPTRSIALMALLGIALLGMLLIVGTMLGANWVRKQGKHRRGPAVPPDVFLSDRRSGSSQPTRTNGASGESLSSRETIVDNNPHAGDDTINS